MQVALCLVFWLKLLLVLFVFILLFLALFHLNIAFDSWLWLLLVLVFHYHSINNNNKNVINISVAVVACGALIRQLRWAPGRTSSTSTSSDADVFISFCYLSNAITAIASCARSPQPQPFIDPIYDDKAGPIDKGNNNNELLWAATARHPLWVILCVQVCVCVSGGWASVCVCVCEWFRGGLYVHIFDFPDLYSSWSTNYYYYGLNIFFLFSMRNFFAQISHIIVIKLL